MKAHDGAYILAIDIGNTHTVLGVYRDRELAAHWRVATEPHRTSDELGVLVRGLFDIAGIGVDWVEGIIAASVVPPMTHMVESMAREYFDREVLVVGPGIKTGISIHYDDPREVGADRIVNAVAGYARHTGAQIIVDFGTATTFDHVGADGSYLGGIIAPGLSISMEALFERASKLPKVALTRPPKVIGRNTVHSMQSGIVHGYAAMVDGLIRKMKQEVDTDPMVLATGGIAPILINETEEIDEVDEFLTLEGLRILFEKNR